MNKNFNQHLDDLLSDIVLPSDLEIKQETTSKKLAIAGSKAGKIAKASGQLLKASSNGGKKAYAIDYVKSKFIESGKIQGKKNVETGFLDSIRTKEACILGGKRGLQAQCVELICPHCNKIGRGRAMYRWHMDKCKHKTID
jgi:hypothetical protein